MSSIHPFNEYFKYKTNTLIGKNTLNISKNVKILSFIPNSTEQEMEFVTKVMQALQLQSDQYQIISLSDSDSIPIVDYLPKESEAPTILLMGVVSQQLGLQLKQKLFTTVEIGGLRIIHAASPAETMKDKNYKTQLWQLLKTLVST